MQKSIFIILSLILFINCDKSSEIHVYYPSQEWFDNTNNVKIDLNNTKLNFEKIANLAYNLHSKDSLPYVSFKKGDTIKNILIINNDLGAIFNRNGLKIKKDSVFKIYDYSIDNLPQLLKTHYENKGDDIRYPDSAEKAYVEIELDMNAEAKELIKSLHNLTTIFDKLNKTHHDSLQLKVALSYFFQIPPPPKPPLEEE